MRKNRIVAIVLAALMIVTCLGVAVSASAEEGKIKIYFIPKNLGNPYFEALSSGFKDAIKELGEDKYEYIFTGPATAEATSQIEYVEAAVQNNASAIFIAANSNDALNGTFADAREAGVPIYLINQDIPGSEEFRDAAIMPVDFSTIGKAQIKLMAEQIGFEGEFAILSATTDAPDQNVWIELMKGVLASDPAYAKMKLVEVVYGDDQPEKSTIEMEALITKYPNLKGVIAPTTVGIAAACKVVQTKGLKDKIRVTGLGLPSEMKEFVLDGTCLGFQLWNPPYEGYLAVYLATAQVKDGFKPVPGAKFSAGKLGEYTVLENGQILSLVDPMLYDITNIEEYAALF